MQPKLIGLREQFTALDNLLTECSRGTGSTALIRGPLGCGKTFLADMFAEHAALRGAYVLSASAEAEHAQPLSVIRDLLTGAGLASAYGEFGQPPSAVHTGQSDKSLLHEFLRSVPGFASRGKPLVICVDEAHNADSASLEWLYRVARKSKTLPVLLVLTDCILPGPSRSIKSIDLLLRVPHRTLNLRPLSPSGVREFMRLHLGGDSVANLTDAVYRITNGNQLLVHALVEDIQTASWKALDAGHPAGRTIYKKAVLSCIDHGGPLIREVSQAVAVLDDSASTTLLSRLLGLSAESVAEVTDSLIAAGLLGKRGRWNDQARIAILDAMGRGERTALHNRAAELLFSEGASATVVMRHLSASSTLDAPWALPILREATEQAMNDGEIESVLNDLRSALSVATDARQRADITSKLIFVVWQTAPELTYRYLPGTVQAARDGYVDAADAANAVLLLLWSGRVDEAFTLLGQLVAGRQFEELDPSLLIAWLGISAMCPGHLPRPGATTPASALADIRVQLASALPDWFSGTVGDEFMAMLARRVLRTAFPGCSSIGAVVIALFVLIFVGQPDEAACSSDAIMNSELTKRSPTWSAFFECARAYHLLRRGDMMAAERSAEAALSRISARSWGIAIGVPLSVQVLAAVAQGKHSDALAYLSVPVPSAMFCTVFGLPYLYARCRYHSESGQYSAALSDVNLGNELMSQWGIDRRAFLDLQARLGEPPSDVSSVAQFKTAAIRSLPSGAAEPDLAEEALSRAEVRVAQLAAQGLTNRQIAARLYVTVSTVEQHLTRVYRKLKVTRRADLSRSLRPVADVAS